MDDAKTQNRTINASFQPLQPIFSIQIDSSTGEMRMQFSRLIPLSLLVLSLAGCQCCTLTERYQDHIDHIADKSPHLDRFYCPGLDLTRIGYPDWCQYRFNRWLYGDCCCRDTRRQPPYIHNPLYVQSQQTPPVEPLPPGQQIPPRQDPGPDSTGEPEVPTQLKPTPDPLDLEKGDRLPTLPPEPTLPQPPGASPPPTLLPPR